MVPQNGANLGNWGSKFCDPQNGTSLRGTTFWQIFLHYRRGSPYLREKSSDFDEIWYLVQYGRYWTRRQSHDQKLIFLSWKSAFWPLLTERFERNFVRGSRTACRQRPRDKNCKFLNSKMATAAILKIVSEDNSASDRLISSNFYKVKQNGVLKKDCDKNWQLQISKIEDGGRPPFWNC